MLGNFIIRLLVLILGYTYPAFECFKSVEKNKVDIEELRFWCQYWILLALISSFEWVGDIFISWLPFYGEMKVAFFVYLWYPKTKGTTHVYEVLLKPYIAQHETEIDRKIMELRARAWDFFSYHFQNISKNGQATLIQAFQYALSQSARFSSVPANQKPVERNVKVKKQSPEEDTESEPDSPPARRQVNRERKWQQGQESADTLEEEEDNIPDTSSSTDTGAKLRRSKSRSQAAA